MKNFNSIASTRISRKMLRAGVVAFSMATIVAPAVCEARVQITVDLSTQTMTVNASYAWPM